MHKSLELVCQAAGCCLHCLLTGGQTGHMADWTSVMYPRSRHSDSWRTDELWLCSMKSLLCTVMRTLTTILSLPHMQWHKQESRLSNVYDLPAFVCECSDLMRVLCHAGTYSYHRAVVPCVLQYKMQCGKVSRPLHVGLVPFFQWCFWIIQDWHEWWLDHSLWVLYTLCGTTRRP